MLEAPRRGPAIAEWLSIVLVFFIFAGGRPPEVNEAHYLAKAKHYWNPEWLAGDAFLESADAHLVFYWSIGYLTRFLSLPAVAWIGRAATWCLLAWAWRRLCRATLEDSSRRLSFGLAALLAALFATAMEWLPMAGEWILGGVEAKGFAFGFVLLALEALARRRWKLVWLFVGAASAFHVLVGGWTGIACGATWLVAGDRREWRAQLPPLIAGLILSLPGLIPALLLNGGVSREVAAEANRIYVFERLSHHLVFHEFDRPLVARFVLASIVWAPLAWSVRRDARLLRLNLFVAASLAIAAIGVLLDLTLRSRPDLAAAWLRFYFFRLSDFALPLGLTFSLAEALRYLRTFGDRHRRLEPVANDLRVVRALREGADQVIRAEVEKTFNAKSSRTRSERHRGRSLQVIGYTLLSCAAFAGLGVVYYGHTADPRPAADRMLTANRSFTPAETRGKYEDWLRVCHWANTQTPAAARFITPQYQQSFKWRAERSEVVNWKDVPQDAASIVAWRRIFFQIYPPAVRIGGLFEHSDAQLRRLGKEHGAQYLVVDRSQAFRETTLTRVYPSAGEREGYYAVYDLSR